MGRNWDNQNVGSIIVSLYHPPKRYSSISFTRSIDLGFGHKDLTPHKSSMFGSKLLLAPFYAFDGINEHGLAVGVAANEETTIKPQKGKQLVAISFLIRKILDQAKDIEEAVKLVEDFIPFVLNKESLSGHLFIVDSSGRSVILEYADNQWKPTYPGKSWQVLSTKPIYNVPDSELRRNCWRYRSMSRTLENTKGNADWRAAMRILQNVAQKGTTWSVVYLPVTKDVYFSVYQDWDTIYRAIMH
jgi:choloylglycine hydrolase